MKLILNVFAMACLLTSLGCGGGTDDTPQLGEVNGSVTLDGSPVPNATVSFHPLDGGRTSTAVTDEAGMYSLTYNGTVKGAKVGQHEVAVSTFEEADDEEGANSPGRKEVVPAKYASFPSQLKVEVKAGENELVLDVSP